MGYPCPACDSVHHDAEHLANHLAVTAMLGSDEHEAWLDEHAPDWNGSTPRDLGAFLEEEIDEEAFPELDEGHDHGHDGPRGGDLFDDEPRIEEPPRTGGGAGATEADVGAIVDEAREMTERMLEKREGRGRSTDGDGTDDEAE